jgi:predicted enzyme related to lactoylglutathione lyase
VATKLNDIQEEAMFKGLRTTIYQVSDMQEAKSWYARVLGVAPYFDQPFYVGFSVGGYELGLQPDAPAGTAVENVVAYWGVDDAQAVLDHLLAAGASLKAKVQDVGEGIKVATVRDPFGNVLGIIENPNFAAQ